jgi:hypothetical protein
VNIQYSILLCFFITIINIGCSGNKTKETPFQLCTNDWFTKIEKKIATDDGQGHGPDLGSLEWRSVIEFKLELRDNPNVPPRESTQWCDYINKKFITNI